MLCGRKQHEEILLQLILLKYFEVVNWIETTEYIDLDDWLTVHRSITLVDFQLDAQNSYLFIYNTFINTLRTRSFKYFKRPFPGFLTILINFYTVFL